MKIIVGLGNPGQDYAETRHNVGFMMIDHLREELNFPDWHRDSKSQADISEGQLQNEKIILLKPQTFMNESGQSVGYLFHFYKIAPMDVIIIHDEVDLPFGRYKVQHDVSSAGHNGIKSIIEKMGTQMFHRVRVGVGKEDKTKQGDTADFVLGRFSLFEKLKLKSLKELIAEEMLKLLS